MWKNTKDLVSYQQLNTRSNEYVLNWSPSCFVTTARRLFHCKIAFFILYSLVFDLVQFLSYCFIKFMQVCIRFKSSHTSSCKMSQNNLKGLSGECVDHFTALLTRDEPEGSMLMKSGTTFQRKSWVVLARYHGTPSCMNTKSFGRIQQHSGSKEVFRKLMFSTHVSLLLHLPRAL